VRISGMRNLRSCAIRNVSPTVQFGTAVREPAADLETSGVVTITWRGSSVRTRQAHRRFAPGACRGSRRRLPRRDYPRPATKAGRSPHAQARERTRAPTRRTTISGAAEEWRPPPEDMTNAHWTPGPSRVTISRKKGAPVSRHRKRVIGAPTGAVAAIPAGDAECLLSFLSDTEELGGDDPFPPPVLEQLGKCTQRRMVEPNPSSQAREHTPGAAGDRSSRVLTGAQLARGPGRSARRRSGR
jgi:hypothetical protein